MVMRSYYGLKPDIKVISPWREWDLTSRSTLIQYAESRGIEVPSSKRGEPPFSMDGNLLHISYEGCSPHHLSSGASQASATVIHPIRDHKQRRRRCLSISGVTGRRLWLCVGTKLNVFLVYMTGSRPEKIQGVAGD